MIVEKAVNMASMMDVKVLGLVENFSYAICPDCGKHLEVFGKSHIDETAAAHGYDVLGRLPIDYRLAALCDKGAIELCEDSYLGEAANKIEDMLK